MWPQAWAWPMAATLLAAPLVYPWYLVWLVPFLVVPQVLPLTIWTVSILSTYVAWRLVGVPWGVPSWALVVEYGALLVSGLWVWRSRSTLTSPPSRYPTPPA